MTFTTKHNSANGGVLTLRVPTPLLTTQLQMIERALLYIEPCWTSPNYQHTPIRVDSSDWVCSQCGIELLLQDGVLERNITNEIAGYSPVPNFLFNRGLGTDTKQTVRDIRGPKEGGSLSRINKRISKGDKTPRHIMESEENRISPVGQGYINGHIIQEQNRQEQVENQIRDTVRNLLERLPQYNKVSAQWLIWGDQICVVAIKQYHDEIRRTYIKSDDGVCRADEFAYAAVRAVLPAKVFHQFKNGGKTNGK